MTSVLSQDQLSQILKGALSSVSTTADASASVQKSSKRCCAVGCKMKLALTAFSCHCGKKFCPSHRYPEDHLCTHDYKKDQKDILLKTMSSAITGAKIEKI